MTRSNDTRRARRQRVTWLDPGDEPQLYALRDALVTDIDAGVRAAALLQLDGPGAEQLSVYVQDACLDASMQVREAAFVALGRARDARCLPRARHAVSHDRSFRVRRMALLCAARACGPAAAPLIALASRDPFWRVRAAAGRAARAMGVTVDTSPVELDVPRADWREIADEDPAVISARLSRVRQQLPVQQLVGGLGDSHRALRQLAVKELAQRGDVSALRDALGWLEDERVPYGPAAAEAALALSGRRAAEVSAQVLAEVFEPSAGALAWAIRHAAEAPAWSRILAWLEHADVRVRVAAAGQVVTAAPHRAALFEVALHLLRSGDEPARAFIATWLYGTESREAKSVLAALDLTTQPTRVRQLAAAALTDLRDAERLRKLASDPHGGVRALALTGLQRLDALSSGEQQAWGRDPDPWAREAVLSRVGANEASRDPSPRVRRAAVQLLAAEERQAWAESAACDHQGESDPWLRARAATALSSSQTPNATRRLLRLARDPDLGVRSAAVHSLSAHRTQVERLLGAGELVPAERIAAYTLLHAEQRAARVDERDPEALAHLALLADIAAGRPLAVTASPPAPIVEGPTRVLGKTGIVVNPFGLSGAHGLGFDDFALAESRAVNLFFWEPSHLELARFLRSRRRAPNVVVAGTYHADAGAIERDVVRALRALRREALDVFLAFWTRSSARIDEVSGILQELSRRGLVRAVGISTHERGLALDAAARGLDVVMVRHSAAHRGAETSVFPGCTARGTAVLTFSNLCYGRMLHRTPVALAQPVTAPDCYRYSLAQAGVGACIAAPRRHSELVENLAVAHSPALSPEREAELRLHGDHVYARSKAWSAATWGSVAPPASAPPASGVAAAPEELADWLERPASLGSDSW